MFEWFKKPGYSNVLQFPENNVNTPYVEPPKVEETYYSIGITSENRITLKTGYSILTMNRKGCEDLIEQLTVFKNQLPESTDD
jgi:hypothetical protein